MYLSHDFHQKPRRGRGGEVVVIARTSLKCKLIEHCTFINLEVIEVICENGSTKFKLSVVYLPRPSSENGFTLSGFLVEFSDLVESYATSNTDCLSLGDFNFHVDVAADRSAQRFISILNDVNLQQHVVDSTHISGHTLNVVISPVPSLQLLYPLLGACGIEQAKNSVAVE